MISRKLSSLPSLSRVTSVATRALYSILFQFCATEFTTLRFEFYRMGGISPLQGQKIRRLRRGTQGNRGGNGSGHRQQQRHIEFAHQSESLLTKW